MGKNSKTTLSVRDLIGDEYIDYNLKLWIPYDKNDSVLLILEKDGLRKSLLYECDITNPRPMSNLFDGRYSYYSDLSKHEDYSALWSYKVNDKVRVFVCLTNNVIGVTYPVGYDLNTRQFVRFPINELGLIDEKKMTDTLNKEQYAIGFDLEKYKDALATHDIDKILGQLIDPNNQSYDSMEIFNKLEEYNIDKIKEANQIIEDKFNITKDEKKR